MPYQLNLDQERRAKRFGRSRIPDGAMTKIDTLTWPLIEIACKDAASPVVRLVSANASVGPGMQVSEVGIGEWWLQTIQNCRRIGP